MDLGGCGLTFALGADAVPSEGHLDTSLSSVPPSLSCTSTNEHVLDTFSLHSLDFERNVALHPVTAAQVEARGHLSRERAGRKGVPQEGGRATQGQPAASPVCLGLTPIQRILPAFIGSGICGEVLKFQ